MQLKKLLQLQLLYYFLGLLFNAVSYYLAFKGEQHLTPTDPIFGSMGMTLYAFFLIPGFLKKITFYRILMVLSIILLGYGGVLKHLLYIRESPELYYSVAAGMIGAGINIFGLVLNTIAALGKFVSSQ